MTAPDPKLLAAIRVVLARTSHPGNIGAAARAMKTMGLSQLYLVDPAVFPNSQADAMASGATDVLANARVCATLDEALADTVLALGVSARRRDIVAEVLTPPEAAERLLGEAQAAPVALVFGNETSGLSNEELSLCQGLVTISANPDYSSLNLAAAVQVLCYEIRQAWHGRERWPQPEVEGATGDEIEKFYAHLETALAELEFLNPGSPGKLMLKLRRLFSRTRLAREEVNILRGILTAAQEAKAAAARSGTHRP
ncbi:RNA methyltransferase [Thiobacillus sedimenti]|uniref:tRNA (cytidine/uridine-2'-O-)-methyltransferase TrmJ n=1 Tax=Thiobacillus sedimenti TaxID=3110231 RepID=A0ABZ1CES1_9PROT|nr:RNA methyltransferase [Thiobacillus sp. SCUT-2]WRS37875.1 RNA methyltransferase [Thiobacillus sp. SCUT-2]